MKLKSGSSDWIAFAVNWLKIKLNQKSSLVKTTKMTTIFLHKTAFKTALFPASAHHSFKYVFNLSRRISASLSSHSQTTNACQPISRSFDKCRESLTLFFSNLANQYS
ncbi:Uncharacterised protein [Salmonella enterica]|nr:Uncharacterised protein [Salmonella enterica]